MARRGAVNSLVFKRLPSVHHSME
ncbi:hypothetical protein CCACVL1_18310 [Corchorus capsularis]|uniref:Uncharacterized protein n=1 Tax=Corchorus capsularis TaxID=210143 RepID=A0A1R3HLZ0_COCAP|nr:hypothetical protein CCACVL1_18310 [Corchorus capsularis]